MKLKKTSVMIEVSEDLYNEIVEPYKKRKGFGRLVVQLLEAYHTNEQIYSYINGTIDGLEDEATEELLKDLNSMAESLSMFGALQSEAEVAMDEGLKAFEEFNNRAYDDRGKYTPEDVTPQKDTLTREDVVNIVNDSVSDIKKMLESLMAGGVVSQPVVTQVQEAVETKVNASVHEAITREEVPLEVSRNEDMTPVVREVSKEEEQAAENAINSLLGSLSF